MISFSIVPTWTWTSSNLFLAVSSMRPNLNFEIEHETTIILKSLRGMTDRMKGRFSGFLLLDVRCDPTVKKCLKAILAWDSHIQLWRTRLTRDHNLYFVDTDEIKIYSRVLSISASNLPRPTSQNMLNLTELTC